jgi:UDP-N-acetylmuramate: L-alanyl-gamma-D-glutamyl-meso-diaminopimelate ligase
MCGRVYASLAKELIGIGHRVTGSDVRPLPPVSDYLREHGIPCSEGFSAENISSDIDLVLANAAFAENPEIEQAHKLGVPVSNFARYLGESFLKYSRNVVVAGSYGKTTTSSMLAWILEYCNRQPSWLVGGIAPNLHDPVRIRESEWWVLEGDEYRSGPDDALPKFYYYNPEIGIVTAVDFVHQDQFESLDEVIGRFQDFVRSISPSGALFAADTPLIRERLAPEASCRFVTVGFSETADIQVKRPVRANERTLFSLGEVDFSLGLRGRTACMNAAMAALAAEACGIHLEECAAALKEYTGVLQRQEVIIDTPDLTIIYDIGIYPRSIAEVVTSIAESTLGRRLCVLFQPRYNQGDEELYYRDLAKAFGGVDSLLLTEAVNLPGLKGAFDFDVGRLKSLLPEALQVQEIGPALKCFPTWSAEVRPGDVWLIMVEQLFLEPLASIRSHVNGLASLSAASSTA